MNRIKEISFNSSLMREMCAIAFVTKLIDAGKIRDNSMKRMLIHGIEAADVMASLSALKQAQCRLGQSDLPDEGGTRASPHLAQHEFRSARTAVDCRQCWKIPLTAVAAVPTITTCRWVPYHHMIRGSKILITSEVALNSKRSSTEEGNQHLRPGRAYDRMSAPVGGIGGSIADFGKPIRISFGFGATVGGGGPDRGHRSPKIARVFGIVKGDQAAGKTQIEQGEQPDVVCCRQIIRHSGAV